MDLGPLLCCTQYVGDVGLLCDRTRALGTSAVPVPENIGLDPNLEAIGKQRLLQNFIEIIVALGCTFSDEIIASQLSQPQR